MDVELIFSLILKRILSAISSFMTLSGKDINVLSTCKTSKVLWLIIYYVIPINILYQARCKGPVALFRTMKHFDGQV